MGGGSLNRPNGAARCRGADGLAYSSWPVSAWGRCQEVIYARSGDAACSGRLRVDFVYTVMLRQGTYEYRAFVRNLTGETLSWTMSLGAFPHDASPPFENPVLGFLAPYAGETLRIGRGQSQAINLETVKVFSDREGGAGPFLSFHDCRRRPG